MDFHLSTSQSLASFCVFRKSSLVSPTGNLVGKKVESVPADLSVLEQIEVDYEVLPDWNCDISTVRSYKNLSEAARRYVERIEVLVGVPIHYVGIRPGRDALILK